MSQAAWAPSCNRSPVGPQPLCSSLCAHQLFLSEQLAPLCISAYSHCWHSLAPKVLKHCLRENPVLPPHQRTELCSSHGFLPAPGSRLLNPAALSLLRSPMIIPSPCFPSTTSVQLISPARLGNDGQRSHRDPAAYLTLSRTTYLSWENSWFDAGKNQLFPLLCRECSLCCRAAIPNGPRLLLMDTVAHKCIGQEGSKPRPIHQH